MNKFADKLTQLSRQSLDILLIKYKVRTSLGVLTGLFLHVLQQAFKPTLHSFKKIDLLSLKIWHFIIAGIFILHIPTIINAFSKKSLFDENIETLFATAKIAIKEGNLSIVQKRMIYISICNQVLKNTVLNDETQQARKEIDGHMKV